MGPRSDPPIPMLTIARIGLPVCPVHAPLRTRSAEPGHLLEHLVDLGHDVLPVEHDRRPARRPQCRVQHGPILGQVDPFASEHRVDPGPQAGFLRQAQEKIEGLVGNPILRIVEEDARRFRGQPLAAPGVVLEEAPQMDIPDSLVMGLEGGPGRPCLQRGAAGTHCNACTHGATPFIAASFLSTSADGFPASSAASSHRRNPPTKALALSPTRQPAGRSFNFLILPPPSTTSSGSRAPASLATTSATSRRHLAFSPPLETALSHVVLVGALPVGQVAQLHRLHDPVDDQRGAEPGAESEEEHLAAPVAAQRLHGGIVDDLHRPSERRPDSRSGPIPCRDCGVPRSDGHGARCRDSRWRRRRTSTPRRPG